MYSLVLEKSSSLVRKMRKICADIFSEAPPKYCARIVPYKFCTISAHFLMPPHMFPTNLQGPLGTTPRTNFAQFSQTRGMFLKSASVQANNVSILGWELRNIDRHRPESKTIRGEHWLHPPLTKRRDARKTSKGISTTIHSDALCCQGHS